MYFYDKNVVSYAKKLKPSNRGELEITDLNNIYLKKNNLRFQLLDSGIAWLDTIKPLFKIKTRNHDFLQKKWIDKKKIKNNLKIIKTVIMKLI